MNNEARESTSIKSFSHWLVRSRGWKRESQHLSRRLHRSVLELAIVKLGSAGGTCHRLVPARTRGTDELPPMAAGALDVEIHDSSPCKTKSTTDSYWGRQVVQT